MKFGRGFSLLETLIATGVLVVVVLGVVALSNSLVAGTVVNADKTIVNRWAVEGLELTQKVRDDNVTSKKTSSSGLPIWFEPAIDNRGSKYGWYKLDKNPDKESWDLDVTNLENTISEADFTEFGETLRSDQTVGYRLICVEAFSAVADTYKCNSDGLSGTVDDGSRDNPSVTDCNQNDGYCELTHQSLNERNVEPRNWDKIIPVGNAVKIRSVIIWEDKDEFRASSVSSLLTNWRGYEQN